MSSKEPWKHWQQTSFWWPSTSFIAFAVHLKLEQCQFSCARSIAANCNHKLAQFCRQICRFLVMSQLLDHRPCNLQMGWKTITSFWSRFEKRIMNSLKFLTGAWIEMSNLTDSTGGWPLSSHSRPSNTENRDADFMHCRSPINHCARVRAPRDMFSLLTFSSRRPADLKYSIRSSD